ncbi:MAG: protein kinase [Deltaproteobacteria bacterium]|nr:protein kinase [Deltaproteobacteria bacterium]
MATQDRTGQTIDSKYRLTRMLGEGGMGAVYEAHHTIINRRCAVKFLHPEIAANAEAVARFVREAQAAASIRHKGIVEVYDVGKAEDGAPYLVMEYLEGESLGAHLTQTPRLPVKDAIGIIVQALSALAPAHRRGIVHRDIKPDNLYIVLDEDGKPTVKLLDFGISKMSTTAANPVDRMTRTGTVLGTPYYMAPEQAAGKSDIDARADLYSMGVILYEALTGRVPFEGDNYNQLILKIFTETPPRPRELNPEIPEGVEAVVLKSMARDKEERYADAEAMIRALVSLLDDAGKTHFNLPLRTTAAVQRLSRTPIGMAAAAHPPTTPLAQLAMPTATDTLGPAPGTSRKGLAIGLVVGLVVAAAAVVLFLVFGRGGGDSTSASSPETPMAAADAGLSSSPFEPAREPVSDATASAPDTAVVAVADTAPEEPPALPENLPTLQAPTATTRFVRISFSEPLPEGTRIVWDEKDVPLSLVPIPAEFYEGMKPLEVRAPGFKPISTWVQPNQDLVITLERQATSTRPTTPTGRTDAGAAPRPDAGGGTTVIITPPPPPPPPDAGTTRRDDGGIRTNFPGRRDAGGASAPQDAASRTEIRTSFPGR